VPAEGSKLYIQP